MPTAETAAAKYAAKLQNADWANAATNYNAAKATMPQNYPFGGKMGRNYASGIARAQYRAPDSADIAKAIRKFRQAAGLS